MAGIPEQIIDQVRERTDIVEVISRYIPLRKAGRNYKATCPFHHEKTPSFMVSQAKQIYHCFGCGAGGNVFNFLMKYERMEFPEAVRELAKRAGIAIPASSEQDERANSLSERLHRINEVTALFYKENQLSGAGSAASRRYLEKRGINQETIEKFKLGYAPKSWDALFNYLKKKGYDDALLEKSGLVIRSKDGKLFDRFRDRIIFPISDAKGKIRGFGSRALDESLPKYMNSPETPIYNKGSHLYGLNLNWEDIRDKNSAVVVEGYVDLLTPYKHGIKNIVASLGTALTQDQIALIKRYTNNVIILYDADPAGENATIRSLDLLVEQDVKVRVAQLTEGYDPDSFINKFGPGEFRKMLDAARDLFDYKLDLLMGRFDTKTLEGKARVASEMLPLLSKINNAILQSGYLKRLAQILSIEEADLKKELAKVKPDYSYRYEPVKDSPKTVKSNMAEKILTGLMLDDSLFVHSVKENLGIDDFRDVSIRKIVMTLFEHYDRNMKVPPNKLMDCFKDQEDVCACISELIATCENLVDKKKSLDDCIQWIRQTSLKERLKMLCDEIKAAQEKNDESKVIELVTRYNDMMKECRSSEAKKEN